MQNRYSPVLALTFGCLLTILLALMPTAAPAQVAVSSASPNNAPQGTSGLNVADNGTGFEKGAKATWLVTGTTDTGGVTVNSTTFLNSDQLVANITVAGNATV